MEEEADISWLLQGLALRVKHQMYFISMTPRPGANVTIVLLSSDFSIASLGGLSLWVDLSELREGTHDRVVRYPGFGAMQGYQPRI